MESKVKRRWLSALLVGLLAWLTSGGIAAQGQVFYLPRTQFFTNTGVMLSGGKLCSYAAGTTTPLAVYSDPGLAPGNALTNPIVLDSTGRTSTVVYISPVTYKFVLLTAASTTTDCTTGTMNVIWTSDQIPGGIAASVITSGVVAPARLGTGTPTTLTFLRGDGTWAVPSVNNLQQSFRNLALRTHPDYTLSASQVRFSADEIVMDDGQRLGSWTNNTVDVTAAGANGLDTGGEGASRWYEIYAIAKDDGTKGGLLHRAKDYFLDESQTTDVTFWPIRRATAPLYLKVAQSFSTDVTGTVEFVDVELYRVVGTPAGQVWFTIEADASGSPSNTPLATSDKLDANGFNTAIGGYQRVIFRTPPTVTAATTYWLVLQGDYGQSDVNHVAWRSSSNTNPYARGTLKTSVDGSAWAVQTDFDACFKVYVTENDTAVTMPNGYTKKAHIGYVYNNAGSNFVRFVAQGRRVKYLPIAAEDATFQLVSGFVATAYTNLVDASLFLPPGRPTTILVTLQNTIGPSSIDVAAVPDGYALDGQPASRGAVRIDTAATGVVPGPDLTPTEYQAIYVFTTGGTLWIYTLGYEWGGG